MENLKISSIEFKKKLKKIQILFKTLTEPYKSHKIEKIFHKLIKLNPLPPPKFDPQIFHLKSHKFLTKLQKITKIFIQNLEFFNFSPQQLIEPYKVLESLNFPSAEKLNSVNVKKRRKILFTLIRDEKLRFWVILSDFNEFL